MGTPGEGHEPVPAEGSSLIGSIPQITLTHADTGQTMATGAALDGDVATPKPKRRRPRPPPLNIAVPAGSSASPLPLTRDLLRRKNRMDRLEGMDGGQMSQLSQPSRLNDAPESVPQIRLYTPSNSKSAGNRTTSCSSTTASVSDRDSFVSSSASFMNQASSVMPPLPPWSPHHIMDLPDYGKYQSTMKKTPLPPPPAAADHHYMRPAKKSYPSLAKHAGNVPNMLLPGAANHHAHHHPSSHHSSYPRHASLTRRYFYWWLHAAARVVHARAPESAAMARAPAHDLLLQQKQHHLYMNESKEKPMAADTHPAAANATLPPPPSSPTPPSPPSPSSVPPEILQGKTLRLFTPSNPWRMGLWRYLVRSRLYELFMLCVLLLHWLLLATHPIYEPSDKTEFHGHWHEYLYLAIQSLYTLDCFAKIIVYGLWIPPADNQKTGYQLLVQPLVASLIRPWKKFRYQPSSSSQPPQQQQQHDTTTPKVQQHAVYHKAYLNSFGNCLDLASIICYWIDFGLMWNNYTSISVFKAMGAAKPLRLLSILPGTAVILKSLEAGWDLMLDVSGFLFFFLFLFAVVGLVTFGGVYSRQCHYFPNGPNQPVPVYPTQFCSGYYNGTDVVGPFDIVLQKNGFAGRQGRICQSGQMCIANTALNPDDGYMNYDMIFAAFLNVYTFVSMELWTDMMYIAMDADSRLAALYFCLGIYIIGFILVYLLLAVITSAFARVRATSSSSSAFTSSKASRSAASMKHHHILQLLYPPEDDVHHATSTGRANAAAVAAAAAAADADAPWDAKYRLVRWKRRLVRIVSSRAFFYAGGFLVFVDGLFMCLRSVYATEPLLEFLDNVETAFTFIFAIEILIRMLGTLHWMDFWLSTRNRIDLALVIVTCVIQLPTIQDSPMYRYLTIFQVLRLYRLFMCIPRLEKLLFAALGTGESVINVMIFLLLSTALFSPIFMQLFGGDFSYIMEDNDPELRFDTFWQSFLTLIMIYTSETWTGTLYDTMSSQTNGGAIYAALATSLYFYYARYIMSGLYIAVILENFELDDVYIRQYQIQQFIRERMQNTKVSGQNLYDNLVDRLVYGKESSASAGQPAADVQIARLPAHLTAGLSKNELVALLAPPSLSFMDEKRAKEHHDHLESDSQSGTDANGKPKSKPLVPKKLSRFIGNVLFPETDDVHISKLNEGITRGTNAEDMDDEDYDLVVAEENKRAMQQDKATRQPVKSLFLFSEDNRLRRFCKRLVGSCKDGRSERQNVFNWVMMLCVLLSILVVILDEPSTRKMDDMSTQRSDVFDTIDLVLGFVFVIELLLRVIADGLLLTPRAYLRHAWNRLDFVVILLNFGTLFANNDQLPRALGTVRSMRILRLIRYFGGMRDVFIDLFHAFPLMMDAMLLTFLVMIPFSIYGVNIFGGRFWTCNDVAVGGRTDCVNEVVLNVGSLDGYDLPLLIPRVWENPGMNLYSFDSFPLALRQLFSLTSTEGWVSSLFYAMSTPAENDTQPVFSWDSPYVYHSIYYVAFMIISHGTVQLFVGVIMEKFKQRSGITTLTFAQRQYVDLQRQLAEVKPTMKPIRPKNALQSLCYEIAAENQGLFTQFMMAVVILNMVILSTEYYDEPGWLLAFQDYFYLGFALLYVLEAAIKLLGLGWKKCWQSKWNIYDAIIAVSAFALTIARFLTPDLWSIRVERYCLIFAAFRLGEGIDALQSLYQTILTAMPSIIRVSAVFMLVMCLFALIFMEFFGLTKYGHLGSGNVNFRTYGNALLLLVRMTTGEGWNEVMMDYTSAYPNCVASDNYLDTDCGSANWAYFLFNFFYITCTHIFLNLFIAVVLSNFEYTYETRSRFTLISKDDLRNFKLAWSEIDTKATGYIQKDELARFFKHLRGRFQVSIYEPLYSIRQLQKLSQQSDDAAARNREKDASLRDSVPSPLPSFFSRASSDISAPPPPQFNASKTAQPDTRFNARLVSDALSKMDTETLGKQRKYYNLLFMEIMGSASSKGLAFSDVLHIMAFRFVDIEQALTLHPLLERLEKLDQLNKAYAAEKARGVFMTLVQRKRYLRQLWHKRNDEDMDRLAFTVDAPSLSPMPGRYDFKLSPLPKIMVEDVVTGDRRTFMTARESRVSLESRGGGEKDNDNGSIPSLSPVAGTPHPDFDDGYALFGHLQTRGRSTNSSTPNSTSPMALSPIMGPGAVSPHSTDASNNGGSSSSPPPGHHHHRRSSSNQMVMNMRMMPPNLSSRSQHHRHHSRTTSSSSSPNASHASSPIDSPLPSPILSPYPQNQTWLMYDGNSTISTEQAHQVLSSLHDSSWAHMLQQQITPTITPSPSTSPAPSSITLNRQN